MAQHASQVGKAGQLVYGTPKYDDDLVYRAIYVDAKRGRNANGTYEITSFALLPFTFDTETWVMHVQPGAAGVWRPGSDDLSTARRLAERAVAAATHNVGTSDGKCPEGIATLLPEIEGAVWVAWMPPASEMYEHHDNARASIECCLDGVGALARVRSPSTLPMLAELLGIGEQQGPGGTRLTH